MSHEELGPLLPYVEKIARAFHKFYEDNAPDYGYKTREASAKPWEEVPAQNKNLMRATVADLLGNKIIKPGENA